MNTSDDVDVTTTTTTIEFHMYGVVTPIISIPGIIGNIFCIIIFTHRAMRSPVNIYLAGLSVFDLLVLFFANCIYPSLVYCTATENPFVCSFFTYSAVIMYTPSLIAHYGSVWTCVAISVDRFWAVMYPLHVRQFCSVKKSIFVLLLISVSGIIFCFPCFFELELSWNSNSSQNELYPTNLRLNPTYNLAFKMIAMMVVEFLIPWTLLIVLNIVVTVKVQRATQNRRLMSRSRKGGGDDTERRCTIMSIAVVVAFIGSNILLNVNNFLDNHYGSPQAGDLRFENPTMYVTRRVLGNLGNVLVCLNSAANSVIFLVFSPRFRKIFLQMLKNLYTCDYRTEIATSELERSTSVKVLQLQKKKLLEARLSKISSGRVETGLSNHSDSSALLNGETSRLLDSRMSNSSRRVTIDERVVTPIQDGHRLLDSSLSNASRKVTMETRVSPIVDRYSPESLRNGECCTQPIQYRKYTPCNGKTGTTDNGELNETPNGKISLGITVNGKAANDNSEIDNYNIADMENENKDTTESVGTAVEQVMEQLSGTVSSPCDGTEHDFLTPSVHDSRLGLVEDSV